MGGFRKNKTVVERIEDEAEGGSKWELKADELKSKGDEIGAEVIALLYRHSAFYWRTAINIINNLKSNKASAELAARCDWYKERENDCLTMARELTETDED